MKAAVDIGTNSIRLLITDGERDLVRRTEIAGLGRGLDVTGRLSPDGKAAARSILEDYRQDITRYGVTEARVVVTAVGRRASDIEGFLDEISQTLGITPEVISGEAEARLSYRGAVVDVVGDGWTVVDIGGGSTEIVTEETAVSFDVGSVVLTDAHLRDRPVDPGGLAAARHCVRERLTGVTTAGGDVIGVAGTWTSLAGMTLELEPYNPEQAHHTTIDRETVESWIERLARLDLAATARLPGLEPRRAPVILGGTIVAATVLDLLEASSCLVSEKDLLDGVVTTMG